MSINFSELRTIHEEASEVEGEGRVGGSASASANGSNGSVGHSNGHGHGHGHGHVHAQASSSNLGRFVGGEMPAPAPQMQIDPALISPERRVGHKASQGRHGSADADGAGPSLAGTKRTYADRLSVTPAPGGAGAHTLAAYGNEAGYARTGNGNSNGNGNGGSYQDGQDGDEDEDEDDDEGEYEDEGDTSGYGHAGYIQEGSDGHDGNGMRAQRGTSEDEARIASGSSSDRTPTGVNIQGAVGEGGAGRLKKKAKEGTTCDNCRKRKIKCKEDTDPYADPLDKSCDGCRKLGIECTYDYVRKKPGRKNGFVIKMRAAQEAALRGETTQSPTLNSSLLGAGSSSMSHNYSGGSTFSTSTSTLDQSRPKPRAKRPKATPYPSFPVPLVPPLPANPFDPGSSSSHPAQPPRPMSSFAFSPKTNSFSSGSGSDATAAYGAGVGTGLDWLDSMLEGTAMGSLGSTGMEGFNWDQANLLAYESPEHALMNIGTGSTATPQFGSGSSSFGPPGFASGPSVVGAGGMGLGMPGGMGHAASLHSAIKAEPQLEDVTSWANISHFISLFLQYLYPLLPLVHRPTFAEHLATRRDLRDTDFRALLLSIVAYVISQLPTSRLVNDQFDIEGLKRLQRRCHRTCKALQRTYYGPTNLTQISTIIFDMFYLLSIGLGHTAGARLGQAVQLAFSMGMNSDERTAALGLDAIEIQLRRRVFWQLYASDKTRAIPGPPMLINDFQGVCSLPSPIDDEFITSQGMFPQPSHRTSILSGFVIVSQLFRILSECFFHHRCVATGFKGIGINWTIEAEERLHRVLKDMPLAIQDPEGHGGGHQLGLAALNGLLGQNGQPGGAVHDGGKGVFAMQRANVLITAAITKFALSDLRAALNIKTDQLAKEREAVAREVHQLLMNIPVEDLASNGESMRGKVFHIACALCAQVGGGVDERGQELIKDWCNMFSAITFVQMPPPPPEENLDSRSNTPPQSAMRS